MSLFSLVSFFVVRLAVVTQRGVKQNESKYGPVDESGLGAVFCHRERSLIDYQLIDRVSRDTTRLALAVLVSPAFSLFQHGCFFYNFHPATVFIY